MSTAIGELIVKLVSDDDGTRMKACRDIARQGSDAEVVIPLLRKIATDDLDEYVRHYAKEAIEQISSVAEVE